MSSRKFSGKTREERGKQAEEAFFKAWEKREHFPEWMIEVSRPTLVEDLFQKTDAVILALNKPLLRIQIKSYPMKERQINELLMYGVIPISIFASDSDMSIRQKTFCAIGLFSTYTRKIKPVLSTELRIKRCNSGDPYYKNGKRYPSKKAR